jgi:hypothetical protein
MKKLALNIPIILIAFLALSCDEKDMGVENEGNNELPGKWLLYETGYSPGTEYIIEPVSAVPPQIIEFKSTGEFSCTVYGLTDYNFYFVKGDILGFFKSDPGPSPDTLAFTDSYHFNFEDGRFKLGFPHCIEGCHLGFKKIE